MRTLVYHATYKKYIQSIQKHGLDASRKEVDNFDFQDDETQNWIFFDFTDTGAIAFAENADHESITDEDIENIILLAVDISDLDPELMKKDPYYDLPITLTYDGIIKSEYIYVVSSDLESLEPLTNISFDDNDDYSEWVQSV